MQKTVVIATGGTGGHIRPAEVIGGLLKEYAHVIYVGVLLDQNPYFNKEKERYYAVDGANFSEGIVKGAKKIWRGAKESRQIFKEVQPNHIIGFGSFHSLPVLLGGRSLGISFSLYEPNTKMGKVNRLFAKGAKQVISLFPESPFGLKGNITPLSIESHQNDHNAVEEARKFFHLDPLVPTILVFGGSKGAESINTLMMQIRNFLTPTFQVIHFTGNNKISESDYGAFGIKAFVAPYSRHMKEAWTACDFAICRSGAATMQEMIYYNRPAILIPYPLAMENHQYFNAKFMQDTIQGGKILEEGPLMYEMIKPLIEEIHQNGKYKKGLRDYAAKKEKKSLEETLRGVL